MAVKAANTGMVIIGGGVIKHHICNANLMVRCCSVHIPIFRN
jgi:deoxyhypusine synthase